MVRKMFKREGKKVKEGQHQQTAENYDEICRICHDTDIVGDTPEPYVTPCLCKGSMGLVHQKCLKRWIEESGKDVCEVCGYKYVTKRVPKYESCCTSVTYWLRDPFLNDKKAYVIGIAVFLGIHVFCALGIWLCIIGSHYARVKEEKELHKAGTRNNTTVDPHPQPQMGSNLTLTSALGLALIGIIVLVYYLILVLKLYLGYQSWKNWNLRNFEVIVLPVSQNAAQAKRAGLQEAQSLPERTHHAFVCPEDTRAWALGPLFGTCNDSDAQRVLVQGQQNAFDYYNLFPTQPTVGRQFIFGSTSNSGAQSTFVFGNQPASVTQPAFGTQNFFGTPALGSQLASGTQPANGPRSPFGTVLTYGSQLASGTQPTNGPRSPFGTLPTYGSQLASGTQPTNGPRSPFGTLPTYGSHLASGTQPANGPRSPFGTPPTLGSQLASGTQPAIGPRSPFGTPPTLGSQLASGTPPAIGTPSPFETSPEFGPPTFGAQNPSANFVFGGIQPASGTQAAIGTQRTSPTQLAFGSHGQDTSVIQPEVGNQPAFGAQPEPLLSDQRTFGVPPKPVVLGDQRTFGVPPKPMLLRDLRILGAHPEPVFGSERFGAQPVFTRNAGEQPAMSRPAQKQNIPAQTTSSSVHRFTIPNKDTSVTARSASVPNPGPSTLTTNGWTIHPFLNGTASHSNGGGPSTSGSQGQL